MDRINNEIILMAKNLIEKSRDPEYFAKDEDI